MTSIASPSSNSTPTPSANSSGTPAPNAPRTQRTPVPGSEWLAFRCTCCGKCCRSLRAAVTHLDVARLVRATGEPAHALVGWLAPDEVDMTGEPGSFVELAIGRRLMVLARNADACRFLDASNRCSVHADRPMDCRLFPFDPRVTSGTRLRRLRVLPLDECDYALDGHNDLEGILADDRARWAALVDYQARVARFNRRMRTRKRLGKPRGTAGDFLAFLGLAAAR